MQPPTSLVEYRLSALPNCLYSVNAAIATALLTLPIATALVVAALSAATVPPVAFLRGCIVVPNRTDTVLASLAVLVVLSSLAALSQFYLKRL